MKERRNISDIGEKYRTKKKLIDRSYFASVGIVITKRCNIHCRHCIYECEATDDSELSRTTINDIIRQIASLNQIKSIVFTGGEPFLVLDNLTYAIELCSELGIETSIITNGFWATDIKESTQKLKKFPGLSSICVSTDTFHQEFVPIQKIRNVILSCNELGIKCAIGVSYLNDPLLEIETIVKQLDNLENYYEVFGQPVTPFGRAECQIDSNLLYSYDVMGMPCLSADGPVIEPNGDVMACCGGMASHNENGILRLGNIYEQSLSDIMNASNSNPIVHVLRLRGPSGLFHLIQKQSLAEGRSIIPLQNNAFHELCTLCKYIITNQEYVGLLNRALSNSKIIHDIAMIRLVELGETEMLVKKQSVKK